MLAGPGGPLDPSIRSFMERGLGHDLGNVRIHAGPQAARAARSLGAVAFTSGSDVVLGPGVPGLSNPRGRRILAHELAHIVQAGPGATDTTLRRIVDVDPAAAAIVEDAQAAQVTEPGQAAGHPEGESAIPVPQKERIVARLGEFVADAEGQSDEEMGRRVAEYLVKTEQLAGPDLDALLSELQSEYPALMQAVAFAGWLYAGLRSFGVIGLAASAGWYVAVSLRDIVAGDFVEDPTALAIVVRTLLTLIPGLDTAADIEDIAANLIYGMLDPAAKLASPGWWFTIALSLIGFFPAFGTAIKGVVKLVLKGFGDFGRAGLEGLLRMLGGGPAALGTGLKVAGELLTKAAKWRPFIIKKFLEIVEVILDHLGRVPAAAATMLADLMDALRQMKKFYKDMLVQASDEVERIAREALQTIRERLGVAAPSVEKKFAKELEQKKTEATQALKGVAAGTHQGLAIKKTLKAMEDLKLVDDATLQAVTNMGNAVVDAFNIPENFVEAMLTLEKQRLALAGAGNKVEFGHLDEYLKTAPDLRTKLTPKAAEYIAAVRALAGNRSVVELHRTGPNSVLIVHRNPADDYQFHAGRQCCRWICPERRVHERSDRPR